MKIGTKSVLYGAHCFVLHWFFVALSWYLIYGWRQRVLIGYRSAPGPFGAHTQWSVRTSMWNPRLWVAFVIHDWGYWGKPNMDGPEGEQYPLWAGRVMELFFGKVWGDFTIGHSRFLAKQLGINVSPLCIADKYAICIVPAWLYLPMVRATGEIKEYMQMAEINSNGHVSGHDQRQWYREMKCYLIKWIDAHKDGGPDTWTSATTRETMGRNRVYK